MPAATRTDTAKVNAIGQEKRPDDSDFNIGCWTFSVERFFDFSPKKYRPPRPMGVKGGCSPQNNLLKSAELVTELYPCRNKNFYKFHGLLTDGIVKHGGRGGKPLLVRRRSLEIWSNREDLRKLPPHVLV